MQANSQIPRTFRPQDVLPHSAGMLLLDEIVAWSTHWIEARVLHQSPSIFADAQGRIPSWVVFEYICQTAAAHAGVLQHMKMQAIKMSFVLGMRQFEMPMPYVEPGQALLIRAERLFFDTEGVGVYVAKVFSEPEHELLLSTEVKAAMPNNPDTVFDRVRNQV